MSPEHDVFFAVQDVNCRLELTVSFADQKPSIAISVHYGATPLLRFPLPVHPGQRSPADLVELALGELRKTGWK
jgi:hypothetical protein